MQPKVQDPACPPTCLDRHASESDDDDLPSCKLRFLLEKKPFLCYWNIRMLQLRGFLPAEGCNWLATTGGLLIAIPCLHAQNFSLGLADAYSNLPEPVLMDALGISMKGGFYYGFSTDATYDSNLFLSETGRQSDVYLSLSPWLAYSSDPIGGATYSLTARYTPSYRLFFDNSQFDSFNHSASANFSISLPRTQLDAFGSFSNAGGTDRLGGGYVEGSIFTYGLRGSYQLAPRTSITASYAGGTTSYDTADRSGADVHSFRVGAFWAANERWSIGPSLRYSRAESGNIPTRESWAALANVRYRVAEKIGLSASLGVDFVTDSRSSGSDPRLTGGLSASYRIDDRWSWSASVRYATVPSPTGNNYVADDLSISTAISRQLTRGNLSAGVALGFSDYDALGPVVETRDDERNLSVFIAYSRPLISDRISFQSTARYSVNRGDREWEQFMLTIGVGFAF